MESHSESRARQARADSAAPATAAEPADLPGAGARGELVATVEEYLDLCEARELDRAAALLAPDVRIEFPGGRVHRSLEGVVSSARLDYRWVRKRRARFFETVSGGDGVVVSTGALYGVDVDGEPFDDVRYIDTFVIRDGLIREQLVWNDLAEHGIGRSATRNGECSRS